MSNFNFRKFGKFVARSLVTTTAGVMITKTIFATIPQMKDHVKTTEFIGGVGGWVVGEKLEPHTDKIVDELFDHYEAKKKTNKLHAV